jgi:PHD/YefM family antitoxin component YafN of YafNO toxin-antitoxin module
MKAEVTIPLSSARPRLFQLVEELLDGDVGRVVLSHRDRPESVVLLRTAELERMDQELTALRTRASAEPRPLRGMAAATSAVDDIVTAVRATARTAAARKLVGVHTDSAERSSGPARVAEPAGRKYRGRRK